MPRGCRRSITSLETIRSGRFPLKIMHFAAATLVKCANTLVTGRSVAVSNVKLPPTACAAEKTGK